MTAIKTLRITIVLTMFSLILSLHAADIVLVQGTISTPNSAERNYAKSITKKLSFMLKNMNIDHTIITDEKLSSSTLSRVRVAILGYNPLPSKSELRTLKSFIKSGGKLVVFYSSSPQLATMMDMQMGKYISSASGMLWTSFTFNKLAPPHLPATVKQTSWNIRPVFPATGGKAKIIALWNHEAAPGETRPLPVAQNPAWLQSQQGMWMTHIILDDGDTDNKEKMLLGLLGFYIPSLWKSSTASFIHKAECINKYSDFDDAIKNISFLSNGTRNTKFVSAMLSEARTIHKRMLNENDNGNYQKAIEESLNLKKALLVAYSSCHLSTDKEEIHAVWDHDGTGLHPGDWNCTCQDLSNIGITDIIVNFLWAGLAHYDSSIIPKSDTFNMLGDQITQCTTAAHNNNMRIHAWVICWNLGKSTSSFIAKLKAQHRLQVSDTGQTLNWLCPSNPKNLQMEKDSIREILKNYPVDGIHLDYIRYNNSHTCFCSGCRSRFEQSIGRKLNSWPNDVLKGSIKIKYQAWRCEQITRLVRDISMLIRKDYPNVKISAAVFGKYPSCVPSVGQDWLNWIRNDYVDYIYPMNYSSDIKTFTALTTQQILYTQSGKRIVTGIGVTAKESRLNPVEVIDQISASRAAGTAGFALFNLNNILAREILPFLNLH